MTDVARDISKTKGKFWEYRLTGVLLKDWVGPIEKKWNDLTSGAYVKPLVHRRDSEVIDWVLTKFETAAGQTQALAKLVNVDLARAWGADGEPGSVEEIVQSCSYIADACKRLLEWEESMHFSRSGGVYSDLISINRKALGNNITEIMKIPVFIDGVISPGAKGAHAFNVVIKFRDGWEQEHDEVMRRLKKRLGIRD